MANIKESRREEVEQRRKLLDEQCKEELSNLNKIKSEVVLKGEELIGLVASVKHEKDNIAILKEEKGKILQEIAVLENKEKETKQSVDRELSRITEAKDLLESQKVGFENNKTIEMAKIDTLKKEALSIQTESNNSLNHARNQLLAMNKEKEALDGIRKETERVVAVLRAEESKNEASKQELIELESKVSLKNEQNRQELLTINTLLERNADKEKTLAIKEKELALEKDRIKDQMIMLDLKQANLNKLESRVNFLIETNSLKDKV